MSANDPKAASKKTARARGPAKWINGMPTGIVPFWRRRWFRVLATTLFILLPVIAYSVYQFASSAPVATSITIGPGGGRHEQVERSLRQQLVNELHFDVESIDSSGSLENIRLMQVGAVDFTIYQTATERTIGESQFRKLDEIVQDDQLSPDELPDIWKNRSLNWRQLDKDRNGALSQQEFRELDSIRFVANLFSEVIHIVVRSDSGIEDAEQLRGKRIAVGTPLSGDYAIFTILLDHLAITPDDITLRHLDYDGIEKAFDSDDPDTAIDAAILSAGLCAPQVDHLLQQTGCYLIPVPRVEAMVTRHVLLSPAKIPAGLYGTGDDGGRFVPQRDTDTVAARAQLLAHKDVDAALVRQVTRVVLSDLFQQENRLSELYSQDSVSRRRFAQMRPEFPIHDGAKAYYDPAEFDAGMFEGWEALYSLIASFLLGMFVLARWLVRRRERIRGHRLDSYLRKLLDIEMRQLNLDAEGHRDDSHRLQELLDEVTLLRRKALGESSAHDLNEDPAQACFLQMCHYVSEKINAKLLRQRLDHRFEELRDVLADERRAES